MSPYGCNPPVLRNSTSQCATWDASAAYTNGPRWQTESLPQKHQRAVPGRIVDMLRLIIVQHCVAGPKRRDPRAAAQCGMRISRFSRAAAIGEADRHG